ILPASVNTSTPSFEEHCEHLILNSINANGFASLKEMFYLRKGDSKIPKQIINKLADEKKIIPLKVNNIEEEYYTTNGILKQLKKRNYEKDVHILSPFDNIVIQRKRLKTLFDFDYTIECYVPAPKRKYGYYVLPILYGEKFIGRLDAKADRENNLFRIINLWWEEKTKLDKNFKQVFKKRIDELMIFSGCEKNNFEKFLK
ncbi:MAG: winged helix DNA-binding domain-containing protein, partial [Bacteroidetes bacterium]|nr:winged helix DNA-binding domain-containing protein [Bacteroidota bacterium]